jgi:peptidoglycan/LPS O-acetylase OafA/YrhL
MPKKISQLDAIRGIAILLVIIHNSDKYPSLHLHPLSANGWMGVDLFFVLSGFLITGILLDTKQSEGYFRNFYARRCLRIWPLYYSLLFFMFVLVPLLRPSEAATIFEARSSPWWSYPFFLQNFLVPIPTMATGPLAVTWSLAIEEQFYLVWPLVVRFCSNAQLRRIAIAVICLSPALRLFLSWHQVNIYSNVFCRLDGLMAGALLAVVVRGRNFLPSRFMRAAWTSLLITTLLAFVAEALHARWVTFSFTAAASASLVYLALFSAQRWLRLVLTNRFIVYTGTISYGLYLLHKIPFDMARSFHMDRYPSLVLPIGLLGAYVVAALSWNFLEKPFLGLKRFFESKPAASQLGIGQPVLMPHRRELT